MPMMATLMTASVFAVAVGTPWEPTAGLPAGTNPVADPTAVVHCDAQTRFTVLVSAIVDDMSLNSNVPPGALNP